MQTLLADGGGLDLRKLCIVRNEMRIAFRAPAGLRPNVCAVESLGELVCRCRPTIAGC